MAIYKYELSIKGTLLDAVQYSATSISWSANYTQFKWDFQREEIRLPTYCIEMYLVWKSTKTQMKQNIHDKEILKKRDQ